MDGDYIRGRISVRKLVYIFSKKFLQQKSRLHRILPKKNED